MSYSNRSLVLNSDNSTAHQATLQLFTCFHLRLPHIRIQPQYTEQILALDMLNELARCPGELYEHLTAEGQEAYLIQPQLQDDNPDPDEDDNNLPFIRHQERFTPLAMRYLDHTKALPSLRFAVDLGDFYFAAYPKTLHEGSEAQSITIRRLKKKVIRYARLNELE